MHSYRLESPLPVPAHAATVAAQQSAPRNHFDTLPYDRAWTTRERLRRSQQTFTSKAGQVRLQALRGLRLP